MAVLKEYVCAAHGEFEAFEPECPHGCSKRFVRQEIRTAPGYTSDGTKRADSELDGLAKDYGFTNIANGKDGESVMQTLRKKPQFAPAWGEVPHPKPGWSGGQVIESPVKYSPAAMGVTPEARLPEVQPSLKPPTPLIAHRHRDQ